MSGCFLFHKWSRWSDVKLASGRAFQFRHCLRCRKAQSGELPSLADYHAGAA